MKPRLILRADGNEQIGLGHVMRLVALARLLGSAAESWFCIRLPTPAVVARLEAAGLRVVRIPESIELADEPAWLATALPTNPDESEPYPVIILDGYHFDVAYQRELSAAGWPLIHIDDLRQGFQWADVLLNHAGNVTPTDYTAVPATTFGLGPAWALLQPEFQALAQHRVSSKVPINAPRWFLNMGGADPCNHTLHLLGEVRTRYPQLPLEVVTGAAYPHDRAMLQATGGAFTTVHHDLPTPALAALLTQCTGFICPPSGISYECAAASGLLLLYPTAENQRGLYEFLTSSKLALPYADLPSLPVETWSAQANILAARQQAVFDGRAAERLIHAVQALETTYSLGIRRATATDSLQYFEWVNEPSVRAQALRTDPILWADHGRWFAARLADTATYLYVLTAPGNTAEAIGQVRIEFDAKNQGLIDYSLVPAWRGRGFGAALLRRAVRQLRLDRPGAWSLLAYVRETNAASSRVFTQLGFQRGESLPLPGGVCEVYFVRAPAPEGAAPSIL
ncbi:MAG: UDP-2,4-diacetamido-2,4,6-trideoxy-beta-L-altropyranose hydrolase [Hymenobacteraceae bacterium]|nr:UDP-2,4-diacetamido-2,4,6-trideoxy-beta-L-altropyranose hydrolase [Hymenobacteraceae bacterium]